MQIFPGQVAKETRIDSSHALVKELENNQGVTDPKIILVFSSNKLPQNDPKHGWEVHVFFNSPSQLQMANLNVETVLADTKIKAKDVEVIKTIYPEGTIGWCGKINGVQVWIT